MEKKSSEKRYPLLSGKSAIH